MINIDQLRISDDGKNLIVDAHVPEFDYLENVYIKSIAIDTEDTVLQSFHKASNDGKGIYYKSFEENDEFIEELSTYDLLAGSLLYHNDDTLTIDLSRKDNSTSQQLLIDMDVVIPSMVSTDTSVDYFIKVLNGDTNLGYIYGEITDSLTKTMHFQGEIDLPMLDRVTLKVMKNDVVSVLIERENIKERYNIEYYTKKFPKEIHLSIPEVSIFTDKPFKHLLFVFIEAEGLPTANDAPCTMTKDVVLQVVLDYNIVYNQIMKYTRQLADECDIPKGFIDMILKLEALKSSVIAGCFDLSIRFFKSLTKGSVNNTTNTIKSNCNCGRL